MRNDGYYVTVDNNGEKSLCDVTYLKTIAKIKKAFNTQYESTYATLHIVKVENGIETIVYVKQFDAVRKLIGWLLTEQPKKAGMIWRAMNQKKQKQKLRTRQQSRSWKPASWEPASWEPASWEPASRLL